MKRFLLLLMSVSVAALLWAGYALQPAGPPPGELSPGIVAILAPQGYKVVDDQGQVYAELWFRKDSPEGPPTGEVDVTWDTVPHGTLIGVIRYPNGGEDRRGQKIRPGVYTLRFSYYPVDGAHQGVEPSRDFLVLSPASIDKDANATPSFDQLMDMSRKASGTRHPAVIPVWKAEPGDWQQGLAQTGEDWVLSVKVGETPISVIVKGVNLGA